MSARPNDPERVVAERPERSSVDIVGEPKWYSCTIDRTVLKTLMQRRDRESVMHFSIYFGSLALAGYAGYATWGTLWTVPAFFAYGTIYAMSEARAHELGHGTPFKTRWLNELLYHVFSLMSLREAYYSRWRHSIHHSHTIVVDHDPEIQVTRPADLGKITLDFFHIIAGGEIVQKIVIHAAGIMDKGALAFVPQSDRVKMIWSSRIYIILFLVTVGYAFSIASFLPLMFVFFPRFYGAWLQQLCQLTQHAGLAENVTDHRMNTRTVYMNPIFQCLYFNMNYHIEHHLYPLVPYHALPKLHAVLQDQLPRTYDGILDAYSEILPALWRQASDATYYVRRQLPAPLPSAV